MGPDRDRTFAGLDRRTRERPREVRVIREVGTEKRKGKGKEDDEAKEEARGATNETESY